MSRTKRTNEPARGVAPEPGRRDADRDEQRKNAIKVVALLFGVPMAVVALSLASRGCV